MWEKHIVGLYISKYRVVKKKKKSLIGKGVMIGII